MTENQDTTYIWMVLVLVAVFLVLLLLGCYLKRKQIRDLCVSIILWNQTFLRLPLLGKVKIQVVVAGNTLGAHLDFIRKIQEHTQIEECSEENCDVIVAFCPVSSRIGTDIDAALLQVSDYKPAILVVMHHTYDQDAIVVDSARLVKKNNVKLSVDCLFFENRGLLENCSINERAVTLVSKTLIHYSS